MLLSHAANACIEPVGGPRCQRGQRLQITAAITMGDLHNSSLLTPPRLAYARATEVGHHRSVKRSP